MHPMKNSPRVHESPMARSRPTPAPSRERKGAALGQVKGICRWLLPGGKGLGCPSYERCSDALRVASL